jgi:SAM-dependent methyltransferase
MATTLTHPTPSTTAAPAPTGARPAVGPPGTAPGARPAPSPNGRARDWAEIQERMLVPLYEAVYARLAVGPATRLLALGCGSGLALLMAAARGAAVTGCEPDERRLALARERLQPGRRAGLAPSVTGRPAARLVSGGPERAPAEPYTLVTALDPAVPPAALRPALAAAARLAAPGSPVVLAGWGPPEHCDTARVLGADDTGGLSLPDAARRAGLQVGAAAAGEVACPFGYPDLDSALRGLLSTGVPDRRAAELASALRGFRRADGTVRMENVFRYLVARVPVRR